MTDTKLTSIEIREVIEIFKPEGFTSSKQFGGTDYFECYNKILNIDNSEEFDLVYYPLFLTRSLEGINELDPDIAIVIFKNAESSYWAFDCGHDKFKLPSTEYKTIDEAKEAVIRYVLKEMRE